jgi:hypothetical protein
VADGLDEISDPFFAACLDGREDTAPAGYSFSSRSDRPADLNNVRAAVHFSGGYFIRSGIALAHGSRRGMAGRRAVPCAPLVPPMAYDPFGCSARSASPASDFLSRAFIGFADGARSLRRLSAGTGAAGGYCGYLTPEQLDAILTHELRHIRYRDNLTAAAHMCVETLFWFHPLVWWIGAQLVTERERDCDEAVLLRGSRPGDYARGILQVCDAYVESPLACASGISGSDLKKRIREIMTWRGSLPVTLRAKALLAAATFAAVSIPFAIGILRAQTLPPAPAYTYEAVSVHKSESGCPPCGFELGPQGGLRTTNTSVMQTRRRPGR